jgi:hypothetical protein
MRITAMEPSARQRRILANLAEQNLIWEVVGRRYFVQFDMRSEREMRLRPDELAEMTRHGWIRFVQVPKAEQRLNRYELVEGVAIATEANRRKPPQSESETKGGLRMRRRGLAGRTAV